MENAQYDVQVSSFTTNPTFSNPSFNPPAAVAAPQEEANYEDVHGNNGEQVYQDVPEEPGGGIQDNYLNVENQDDDEGDYAC